MNGPNVAGSAERERQRRRHRAARGAGRRSSESRSLIRTSAYIRLLPAFSRPIGAAVGRVPVADGHLDAVDAAGELGRRRRSRRACSTRATGLAWAPASGARPTIAPERVCGGAVVEDRDLVVAAYDHAAVVGRRRGAVLQLQVEVLERARAVGRARRCWSRSRRRRCRARSSSCWRSSRCRCRSSRRCVVASQSSCQPAAAATRRVRLDAGRCTASPEFTHAEQRGRSWRSARTTCSSSRPCARSASCRARPRSSCPGRRWSVNVAVLPAVAVAGPLSVSVPVNGAVTLTVCVVVFPPTVSLTAYVPGVAKVCGGGRAVAGLCRHRSPTRGRAGGRVALRAGERRA